MHVALRKFMDIHIYISIYIIYVSAERQKRCRVYSLRCARYKVSRGEAALSVLRAA